MSGSPESATPAGGMTIAATVEEIVVDKLERKPEEVTMDARFIDDLGADSLDITELLMALEEAYSIDIDDEANDIQSVGDAVVYILVKSIENEAKKQDIDTADAVLMQPGDCAAGGSIESDDDAVKYVLSKVVQSEAKRQRINLEDLSYTAPEDSGKAPLTRMSPEDSSAMVAKLSAIVEELKSKPLVTVEELKQIAEAAAAG